MERKIYLVESRRARGTGRRHARSMQGSAERFVQRRHTCSCKQLQGGSAPQRPHLVPVLLDALVERHKDDLAVGNEREEERREAA